MQPEEAKDDTVDDSVNEVFSAYVAALGPGGDPPDIASYEAVREGLRGVLVARLRRRALWHAPPSFLGYAGARWSEGALDELVSDAYTFTFIHRLRGLRDQQQIKGNIRPMVIRNVSNFLTELQARADPVGYRVFGRLRQAIEQRVERKDVFVLNAEPGARKLRLGNGSLIGCRPEFAAVASRSDLAEPARRFNDDLMPGLITAEGRAVPEVVARLAEKVPSLQEQGVAAFRLGDLAAELKNDARRRWDGVWRTSLGELGQEFAENGDRPQNVPVERFDDEPDWPRRHRLILECVETSLDRQRPLKNRRDLWSLWTFIRSTRVLPRADGPLPSFAELGRQLQLTRDRVRQLVERLKPLVMACLKANLRTDSQEEASDEPTAPKGAAIQPARWRAEQGR